jgi:hypothetical protein
MSATYRAPVTLFAARCGLTGEILRGVLRARRYWVIYQASGALVLVGKRQRGSAGPIF